MQRKFKRDSGLDSRVGRNRCGRMAASRGLFNALAATVDAGDEVVIPVPSWNAYPLMTQFLEGKPVFVACPQNNGFKPRPEDIEAAITPRAKMPALNNPNNPTVRCTAEELEGIATVLRRHPQMWVISDDMVRAPDVRRASACDIGGGGTGFARSRHHYQRRIQDVRDDGLAGRFCARPAGRNPRHGECAGTDYVSSGISTVGQAAAVAALDGPQESVGETAAALSAPA